MHTTSQKIESNTGHGARGTGEQPQGDSQSRSGEIKALRAGEDGSALTTNHTPDGARGTGEENQALRATGGSNRAASRERKRSQAPGGADCTTVSADSLDAAPALLGMAHCSAGAFARRWEATGARAMTESDLDEARAIYHTEFARAANLSNLVALTADSLARIRAERDATGRVPMDGASFAQDSLRPYSVRRGNALPFRALLAWRRAMRAANRRVRAMLWGHGAELVRTVSFADLLHQNGHTLSETVSAESLASYCAPIGTAGKRRLRILCAHARESLAVYWMSKGGQRWRTGLRNELCRVAHCARAVLGGSLGIGAMGDLLSAGGECGATMRQSAKCLRDHIASGDKTSTERPELSAELLALYRRRNWDARPIARGESDETRDRRETLAWARHRAERLASR